MPFKKLFKSSSQPTDGLTQSAREAIVDVLHYVMYADKHIAEREDQFIEDTARSLSWDANISYEYYEGKSTGAVTRALGDASLAADLLNSVKSRLPRKADRELALTLAGDLAKSDGQKTEAESAAIAKLRSALLG